ncbi:2-C-methyl-D-erythritol 4-phosphate cytidylyltransferase [Kineosporia sp. J2-2]|uniref:2-C-methyl-D-erythritol 4-phosphate cytidylyltransferase n=1 Tax=Kineosporia corallincola TaxID=2835133 RepID=A0ABS5T9E1_9ACTN|nr:2-C-methyl-D-erythritol 4-phosphate cytidylyltransferase [Kineosporia corallincola]MBT0767670.1 2-C-methyl-D-erythritol 4-phosphate cytidylyltransferase [Kineosporia corallincola]
MSTAFVAVIHADRPTALTPPGACAVHTLRDLAGCAEPDDRFAVLLGPEVGTQADAQVDAVLATLEAMTPAGGEPGGVPALVVASVRPVTDTLKRVGPGGALTGTADREHHRFVATPLAVRLGSLRAALEREPGATTAGEILGALVAGGATVVAGGTS